MRRFAVAFGLFLLLSQGEVAHAQRFGGQFGAAAGFWLQYLVVDIKTEDSFGRDLGNIVLLGGRGFVQSGRVRLGFGAFGGSHVNEGVNAAGNEVTGGLSGAGFTAEYLVVQKNLELVIGGFAGGGTLLAEERLGVSGDVEMLNRREDTIFFGIPWVRLGYNIAPFVNTGIQLGYLVGSQGLDGLTLSIDVFAGLIP